MLPNGRDYCAELARNEDEQDACIGDLEDALYSSNADKAAASQTLRQGINRIKAARMHCSWYQVGCHADRRALQDTGPRP